LVGDNDFHNIETKGNLGIVEHAQPSESAAGNAPLLIARNRFEGSSIIFPAASFHFHKDERVIVATDEIDLASLVSLKTPV
jgi:hypothetical protein